MGHQQWPCVKDLGPRLEQSPVSLVAWREMQGGNIDFKEALHCLTSKNEPNYNCECGQQGQWSS